MNLLKQLQTLDQSLWLDDIRRGLFDSGEFQRLLDEDGICGVTSNPTILNKSITEHSDYDQAVRQYALAGGDEHRLYEQLVLADLQCAADLLWPVYQDSDGRDGYVSMEVSPHLAYDTGETIIAARRLWGLLGRPNAMIKVPATREGLPAIRTLIGEGININATLLFSVSRYNEVASAFIEGLSDREKAGAPVGGITSVASFFMSRIDMLIDKQLDTLAVANNAKRDEVDRLRGQVAVASAGCAYRDFKKLFSGPVWESLLARGGQVQRLLWASTGTKDRADSDVKYVEALIAPDTVNTLPLNTLAAYRDHGNPAALLEQSIPEAESVLQRLAILGIDLDKATRQLEREGVEKFIQAYDSLLNTLSQRIQTIRAVRS